MSSQEKFSNQSDILLAFFREEETVQRVLDRLIKDDFPLDQISLLARVGSTGDDPLGVYYTNVEERVRGWGKLGAIWGGVLGGMVGLFIMPGLGPLMIAGPLIEGLLGAGLGGALGAGGAALSEISVAIHRMGIPAEKLQEIEGHIESGYYVLALIVDQGQAAKWELLIGGFHPIGQERFPFLGVRDALNQLF